MLGERRGLDQPGRAFTFVEKRKDRLATAAVLLAIAVSLAGACVVILEAAVEPPHGPLTIAAAEVTTANPENSHAR